MHQSANGLLLNKASNQTLSSKTPRQYHITFIKSLDMLSNNLENDVYGFGVGGFSALNVLLAGLEITRSRLTSLCLLG